MISVSMNAQCFIIQQCIYVCKSNGHNIDRGRCQRCPVCVHTIYCNFIGCFIGIVDSVISYVTYLALLSLVNVDNHVMRIQYKLYNRDDAVNNYDQHPMKMQD